MHLTNIYQVSSVSQGELGATEPPGTILCSLQELLMLLVLPEGDQDLLKEGGGQVLRGGGASFLFTETEIRWLSGKVTRTSIYNSSCSGSLGRSFQSSRSAWRFRENPSQNLQRAEDVTQCSRGSTLRIEKNHLSCASCHLGKVTLL